MSKMGNILHDAAST